MTYIIDSERTVPSMSDKSREKALEVIFLILHLGSVVYYAHLIDAITGVLVV